MKRWISLFLVLILTSILNPAHAYNTFIGFARVDMNHTNVRKQPNGDTIQQLMAGAHVFVIGESVDAHGQIWYQVNFKPRNGVNKTGWIRGDLLKLSRDIFVDVKKIAVSNNLIAVLKKDGSVTAMGEQFPQGFDPDTIGWTNISDIAAGICTVLGVTDSHKLVGIGNYASIGFGDAADAAKVYMINSAAIVVQNDSTVFASDFVLGKRYLPDRKGALALPSISGGQLTNCDALSITRGSLLNLYEKAGQELGEWRQIKAVAAGAIHHVLLMKDGTVTAFGKNYYGAGNVTGWTDVVQVACANFRTVGLKRDGTVLAVGYNGYGECDVSDWRNIVQVECAERFTVGLTADGQVLVAGEARFDHEQNHDSIYKAIQDEIKNALQKAYDLDNEFE